jgi:two-component system CheB/CheR fusion protein
MARRDPIAVAREPASALLEDSLRRELASMREYLQAVINELEASNEATGAANEEIAASNAELRSANEELQAAQEELQATNEALRVLNGAMVERTIEATGLADDLSNIFSSVAIPIVILGRDSTIRRFTPAATRILSLISSDVGRPIADIRAKVPIPELAALMVDVLQSLVPVERTVQAEDGRWYQLAIRPYRTLDDRIDGMVLTAHDLDAVKKAERVRAEDQLARSEAGFREMLMTAAECVIMSNSEGRIVFANEAAGRMFGYEASEMLGLPLGEALPLRRSDPHAESPRGALFTPAPQTLRDHSFLARRKDGVAFPVEVSLSGMEGTEGRLTVAFVADVSARREAERRIKDYQIRLQQMAFEAAKAEERERRRIAQDLHDRVGQSLTVARIKLGQALGAATTAVHALISAANDLIASSIEDTRTLTFELAPPVLYDLGLKAALSWLSIDVEKRLGVRVEVTHDGGAAPSDATTAPLLFRAVRELLTNVYKHAKTSSARIALARNGDHFEILVEDRGAGFDVEHVGSATSGGFGLFSVREQIARLGGTVEVESASGGTSVTLRVPVMAEEEAPSARKRGLNEDLARG